MQRIIVIAVGLGLASMNCGSRASRDFPEEIKDLITSAPDRKSREILTRCAEEWWPVLSGKKLASLHVVMNVDYVIVDVRDSHPATSDLPESFPEGKYRIKRRFEIWQQPPDHQRIEGPFGGVEMKTWIRGSKRVAYFPETGIHKVMDEEEPVTGFGLSPQLEVVTKKVRTAAKLGTLAVIEAAWQGDSLRLDVGIRHHGNVGDASSVPPLARVWIDAETAKPQKAVFFGGDSNLEVTWHELEKGQPIPPETFEPPPDLGREASDEEFIIALFGGAFTIPEFHPGYVEPTRESRIETLRQQMAFWGEVLFCEEADEGIPGGQGISSDGKTTVGRDSEGISIEILEGEPWTDVTITINADLGPEAYSAHIGEVTPGRKVTVPFSRFRNSQGITYSPINSRFGRTTIEAGGEKKRGIAWEDCL